MINKLFAVTIAFVMVATVACGQKSPRVKAEGTYVKVDYGQPSKRGRVIFGELVPYEKVWRTGANEATQITFTKDGTFGGKPIKAGTYTLFTIPRPTEWTLILNSELGQWGAYSYDKNKDKDVLQVNVPAKKLDNVVEKLTYEVSDKALNIQWDQAGITIPLSF